MRFMQIFETLSNLPPLKNVALTIGTFDAIHLGHQHLFQELKKRGTPVVLTFSNHPLEILNPSLTPPSILSPTEKLDLFKTFGIEMTLLIPFTQTLAQTPYDIFIKNLHTALPFSFLVLGEDARLGAHAAGTPDKIQDLAKIIGFKTFFCDKIKIESQVISSSQIRKFIQNNQIDQAQKWLGHSKGL
jgi:riboflavin kinase/FMN adenylyltransferase